MTQALYGKGCMTWNVMAWYGKVNWYYYCIPFRQPWYSIRLVCRKNAFSRKVNLFFIMYHVVRVWPRGCCCWSGAECQPGAVWKTWSGPRVWWIPSKFWTWSSFWYLGGMLNQETLLFYTTWAITCLLCWKFLVMFHLKSQTEIGL